MLILDWLAAWQSGSGNCGNGWSKAQRVRRRSAQRVMPRSAIVERLEGRQMLSGLTVNLASDTEQEGSMTLRQAITQANLDGGGDTITFDSGLAGSTLTLTQGELLVTAGMTIIGLGADQLTIDGQSTSRIFDIHVDSGQRVEIRDFTLQNGNGIGLNASGRGGAIYNAADLSLQNVTLSGNSAVYGGGLENVGVATLVNDRILGNNGVWGGGLFNEGTLTSTNLIVEGNFADYGGGIGNSGTLSVSSSVVASNTAAAGGGAIWNGGFVRSTNTMLTGNSAETGGGVSNESSLVSQNDTFSGNTSTSSGGGLSNQGQFIATNDTLCENLTAGSGGGIANTGTLTLTNNTIAGNGARVTGGGIENDAVGTLNLLNTIVIGNTAPLASNVSGSLSGQSSHNQVSGVLAETLQTDRSGLPLLANHGGLTWTVPLVAGSPAMGAGTVLTTVTGSGDGGTSIRVLDTTFIAVGDLLRIGTEIVAVTGITDSNQVTVLRHQAGTNPANLNNQPVSLAFDQRDFPRVTQDLGSIHGPQPMLVVTSGGDTHVQGAITLREAITQANVDGSGDTITFDQQLAGSTLWLTQGELLITSSVTITGPDINLLTIEGNQSSRIFRIQNDTVNPVVTMSGLKLTGGNANGSNGDGTGGAIYNGGQLTLANMTLTANTADYGGGLYNTGTLVATLNTIIANQANYGGGGIDNETSGTMRAMYNTIAGNTAGYIAGGIFNGGTLTSMGNTISGNTSTTFGGGFYNEGAMISTNETIANNTAGAGLGGGGFNGGILTLVHDTLSGNSSSYGGGIFTLGTLDAINSILVGNMAGTSDDLYGSLSAVSANNLVGGRLDEILRTDDNVQPQLADHGGTTQTIPLATGSVANKSGLPLTSVPSGGDAGNTLVVGDTTFIAVGDMLRIGSEIVQVVSIDGPSRLTILRGQAGTVSTKLDAQDVTLAFDQRDFLRETNDLGAIHGPQPFLLVSSSSDTHLQGAMTLREAIAQANMDGSGDAITFSANLSGTTIPLTKGELRINSSVSITGLDNHSLIIDAGGRSRIFDIASNSSSVVSIANLTLQRGNGVGANGNGSGGAIYNTESLLLLNDTIRENVASINGGGIENLGLLRLSNTTIGNNTASQLGGGIDNRGIATATYVTIAGNSSSNGGGLHQSQLTGEFTALNTLIIGNTAATGSNLAGGLSAESGNNLVEGNLVNILETDSQGKPVFADHGGATPTIALIGRVTNPALGYAAALTALAEDLSSNSLIVNVVSALGLNSGDLVRIDVEIVRITGIAGNQLTLTRGEGGTPTGFHSSGAGLQLAYDQRSVARRVPADLGAFETQESTLESITIASGEYTGHRFEVTQVTLANPSGGTIATFGDPGLSYVYYAGTLSNGELAGATPLVSSPKEVGHYTVVVYFDSDIPGYRDTVSQPVPFEITPATLTIIANNDSKVYGTLKTFSSTAFTQTGLVSGVGDGITFVTETSTGSTALAGLGTFPITPSDASGIGLSNYHLVYVNGTLTVNPRVYTVVTTSISSVYMGLSTGPIDLVDFQDLLAVSSPTTYTATIDWGDGLVTTNMPVTHSNAEGTTVHVVGSHTYTTGGTYHPIITLRDAGGTTFVTDSTNTATVTVQTVPAVRTQPTSITVTAGSTASFTVVATGDPTPTIQWQVSTNRGSSWSDIPNATAATYSLSTFVSNGGDQYRAVLTNPAGAITSNVATLTVNSRSFITSTTYTTTVFMGLNTGLINLVDIVDPQAISLSTTYTATIKWGDGNINTNVAVSHSGSDGTTIHVMGDHTYSVSGSYEPLITLFDGAGSMIMTVLGNTAKMIVGANVSNKVSITRSSPIKNRTTGLWAQTVTMNNISGGDLTGNIDFVLIGLTAGVSLANATGLTAGGADPYLRFSRTGLKAGKSISLVLNLMVPTTVTAFNYKFDTFTD